MLGLAYKQMSPFRLGALTKAANTGTCPCLPASFFSSIASSLLCSQLPTAWDATLVAIVSSLTWRNRSIPTLGLFNDTFATFFVTLATWLFMRRRWLLGCCVFSFAVSIKMNVLLYSPGLLLLLLQEGGVAFAALHVAACGAVQVALAAPFLLADPVAYLSKAFNLGRQFTHAFSVNWKFVPAELFASKAFALGLLAAHVLALAALLYNFRDLARRRLGSLLGAAGGGGGSGSGSDANCQVRSGNDPGQQWRSVEPSSESDVEGAGRGSSTFDRDIASTQSSASTEGDDSYKKGHKTAAIFAGGSWNGSSSVAGRRKVKDVVSRGADELADGGSHPLQNSSGDPAKRRQTIPGKPDSAFLLFPALSRAPEAKCAFLLVPDDALGSLLSCAMVSL